MPATSNNVSGLEIDCSTDDTFDDDEKEWSDTGMAVSTPSTPLPNRLMKSVLRSYGPVRSGTPCPQSPVSILRSSPWCPFAKCPVFSTPKKRKRVLIASPLKWNCQRPSTMERKRGLVRSTISHHDIKRILHDLGCDPEGDYLQCTERLLASSWTPPREHIESEERSRAKPIEHGGERIIELTSGTLQHLETVSTADLKGWLKQNRVEPQGVGRREMERTVSASFGVTTPIQDRSRIRFCPKTSRGSKLVSRTKGQRRGGMRPADWGYGGLFGDRSKNM